jgi:hypothetical protein
MKLDKSAKVELPEQHSRSLRSAIELLLECVLIDARLAIGFRVICHPNHDVSETALIGISKVA